MTAICRENSFSAYGFDVVPMEVILNIPLPEPFDSKDNSYFKFSSLGKLHKTGEDGSKVYKYNCDSVMQLYQLCRHQVLKEKLYRITQYIGSRFTKQFDSFMDKRTYAVKVIKASTYRHMVAGMKEACMTNEVFAVCDVIVSKPFFCAPFWDGKEWLYVIITEFITGSTIKDMRIASLFRSKHENAILQKGLEFTIYLLWWNGFSHNNLQKSNIIYDKKRDEFKLVGMSHCVSLSHPDTCRFRRNIVDYSVPFKKEYMNSYKEASIKLARYATVYGKTTVFETDDIALNCLLV
jgi:hypothetical protein